MPAPPRPLPSGAASLTAEVGGGVLVRPGAVVNSTTVIFAQKVDIVEFTALADRTQEHSANVNVSETKYP
jgi:hypothetical protein